MRLICPNCSAQYEIDASLVPDEGRDVQCSNCGHTWFELPPAEDAFDAAEDLAPASEETFDDGTENAPSHAAMAIAAASEDQEEDDAVYDAPPQPAAAPPKAEAQQRRRTHRAELPADAVGEPSAAVVRCIDAGPECGAEREGS